MNEMDKKITEFDKRKLFEERYAMILELLRVQMSIDRIPFMYSVCVRNSEEGTEYVNQGVMPRSHNIYLKDDKLSKLLCVLLEFDVIAKKKLPEVNMANFDINEDEEDEEDEEDS